MQASVGAVTRVCGWRECYWQAITQIRSYN